MLLKDPIMTNMLLTIEEGNFGFFDETIRDFQNLSSSEFSQILPNSLWIISEENLKKIFKRIEKKTNYEMPDEVKKEFLLKFKFYREFIEEELDELYNRKGR